MPNDPSGPEFTQPTPPRDPALGADALSEDARRALDDYFGQPQGLGGDPAIAKLLDLLGADLPSDGDDRARRIEATLGRVRRSGEIEGSIAKIAPEPIGPKLTDASAGALDVLAGGGSSVDADAGALQALSALLNTLDLSPSETAQLRASRDERCDRVLAKVEIAAEKREASFRMPPVGSEGLGGGRRRFGLGDLIATAAAVLIGVSVIWPSATSLRERQREALCASNLQGAGIGFGLFASANDGRIPAAPSQTRSSEWWTGAGNSSLSLRGNHHSHSANLFVLAKGRFTAVSDLACPGNAAAPAFLPDLSGRDDWDRNSEVSYSYQLFGKDVPRLSDPTLRVLLSDRSPAVDRAVRGESFSLRTNSSNHKGYGQTVLTSNLSIRFIESPDLAPVGYAGDSLWTNQDKGVLVPLEQVSPGDAHVGH